jgi:20S proteasome subunit beta 1
MFAASTGAPPSVHTAASIFQKLCYENKDNLSAGIIVAGCVLRCQCASAESVG